MKFLNSVPGLDESILDIYEDGADEVEEALEKLIPEMKKKLFIAS